MRIKQVRVAQSIRGETSNLLEESKYNMHLDKGILYAELKHNPKGLGKFLIFPANIAYLEYHEEIAEGAPESLAPVVTDEKKPTGRTKK